MKVSAKHFRGFTLVELIVVITILAILATVGFLALSGYTQDAKDSAIKANVRSLQTAITSEAAITNNSPRYYVIHDSDYALSGAFAYVDGASVALTGWDVGSVPLDSNYTAGKPDFKKLKLNPEKFRISASGLPGGTLGLLARATGFGAGGFGSDSAEASYDANSLMAAGADFTTAGANGKKRIVSYVQTAGISPATKLANVAGNFPASDVPAGNVSWLLRAEPGSATNLTGALLDGAAGKVSTSSVNVVGNDSAGRSWSNGTYARSCSGYLNPTAGKTYAGATGNGIYVIDPDGSGPVASLKAYCDMTSSWGGWTMVVAQFESDMAANWNEGTQADYDPTLATSKAFALSASQIPAHSQTAFGSWTVATYLDYANFTYSTWDIGLQTLAWLKTSTNYQIHRSTTFYYWAHNPEQGGGTDAYWNDTLTFDATGWALRSWAFCPNQNTVFYRGYSLNWGLSGSGEPYAWTVWVR